MNFTHTAQLPPSLNQNGCMLIKVLGRTQLCCVHPVLMHFVCQLGVPRLSESVNSESTLFLFRMEEKSNTQSSIVHDLRGDLDILRASDDPI